MTHFFISYNRADRLWAEWSAWELEETGFTTVLQAWDFRPGSNFVDEMDRASRESERTIAVLSPDYLTSDFTAPEWQDAFRRDPTGEEGLLLPIRVREAERTGLMASRVFIDLVGLDEDAARLALRAGVEHCRAKPLSQPSYPGGPALPPELRTVSTQPRFPVRRSAIWNVPHRRNPKFAGQEALLAELEAAFGAKADTASAQVVALYGLAGSGKTQLAIKYAHRHVANFDVVWWVRCQEPATLAGDYAGLASELGLPEAGVAEHMVAVAAVRRWLEHSVQRWLLVFDDADDPEQLVDYLPRIGAGHILITSQSPAWGGVARPVHVNGLPLDEAVSFLLQRRWLDEPAAPEERTAAETLAREFDGLPLALDQAAAFTEETGTSLTAYLRMFRSNHAALLAEGASPTGEYSATVLTTWELAFRRIEDEQGVADFLALCAFLAPEAIPRDVLTAHANLLPEPLARTLSNPIAESRAIGALRRYSLVHVVDDRTFGVYRLVQAVTRYRLPTTRQRSWARHGVHLLSAAFPKNPQNEQTWPEAARLVAHAVAVTDHASALGVRDEVAVQLVDVVRQYLEARAVHDRAR